jgi:membrane-bound lytic murein transglycosylase D
MVSACNNDMKPSVMKKSINKTIVLPLTTLLISACAQQPNMPVSAIAGKTATATKSSFLANWYTEPSAAFSRNSVPLGSEKDGLWQRIRSKLSLLHLDNPRVEEHVDYLRHNPGYVYTLSERAQPFMHYIVGEIELRGLPMDLALVPMVESAFEPAAVSPKQAAGLWQIMPATGRQYGLTLDAWYDGRQDIQASTQAALDYLKYLNEFFAGDWLLTLAAYNAGEGTVQRAIDANREAGKPTDYWNLELPRETLAYVPKILALSRVVANPRVHGLALRPINDEPYLVRVAVGPQTNLSSAAALAGMSKDQLNFFNACFKRGVTPPRDPYKLLLPRNQALALQEKLEDFQRSASLPPYIVKHADSLITIAPPPSAQKSETLARSASTRYYVVKHSGPPVDAADRRVARRGEPTPTTRLRPGKQPEKPSRSTTRYYVVRHGDSLISIAQRHGVSDRKLAQLNGLPPNKPLKPGQKLMLASQS